MNHEPISIRQIASEATAQFIDIDENRDAIRDEFNARFQEALETGALSDPVPGVRELRASWGWQQAGREAQSMGARIRRALSEGQSMLEFEEDSLDQMLVICEERRATLRLLTADDLVLMSAESRKNRAKIEAADDALQQGIAALVPVLRMYANWESYRNRMRDGAA